MYLYAYTLYYTVYNVYICIFNLSRVDLTIQNLNTLKFRIPSWRIHVNRLRPEIPHQARDKRGTQKNKEITPVESKAPSESQVSKKNKSGQTE